MSSKRYGQTKLLWRQTTHSRVTFARYRLPNEEESTLQFYSDFAGSLSKAEVRPDTERTQKDSAMSEYNSIAFNYEDQGDFVTASYFYKKVI